MAQKTSTRVDLHHLHPLAVAAAWQQGINLAEFVRRAVADKLGVDPPHVVRGNPEIGAMSKAALAKRWGNDG